MPASIASVGGEDWIGGLIGASLPEGSVWIWMDSVASAAAAATARGWMFGCQDWLFGLQRYVLGIGTEYALGLLFQFAVLVWRQDSIARIDSGIVPSLPLHRSTLIGSSELGVRDLLSRAFKATYPNIERGTPLFWIWVAGHCPLAFLPTLLLLDLGSVLGFPV